MAFALKELGNAKAVGTTYTSSGQGTGGNSFQGAVHIANLLTSIIEVRAYIADATWVSGEPAAGALVATLAKDIEVPANGIIRLGPFQIEGDNELVVRCDTASGMDVHAFGVEES